MQQSDTEEDIPLIAATPRNTPQVTTMPKWTIFMMNFTQFSLNFLTMPLRVILIPSQVEMLARGDSKGAALGVMVGLGACLTCLSSLTVGVVSDRLTWSLGRRRPVMLIATGCVCAGLLGMALTVPVVNYGSTTVNSSVLHDLNPRTWDITNALSSSNKCDIDLEAMRCKQYIDIENNHTVQKDRAAPMFKSQRETDNTPDGGVTNYLQLILYGVFTVATLSSKSAVYVSFNALVADISHPAQRGVHSGIMGFMILLGNFTGAIAGIGLGATGIVGMYSIIIAVMVMGVVISACSVQETRPESMTQFLGDIPHASVVKSFWSPLKDSDFRWVFVIRFLMQMGVVTITTFFLYWIHDMIPLPYCMDAITAVAFIILPSLLASSVSSLVFGVVSDRSGYRKIIVAISAFTMGLGAFMLAFLTGDYAYYTACIVAFTIGVGFGGFESMEFALLMDVLREEAGHAKDIAVWHQAEVLPQVVAAPLGGLLLDGFNKLNCHVGLGYIMLFLITSLYACLAGTLVFKIKSVH